MPKHGFLTPKAVANRIKSKGLQKLKWYCQMCAKQCRDENGFKCHKLSESHQRKMKLFIQAPGRFMNDFSREFDHGFMQILRLKGGRRVKANEVYQDYIANREHIHMNATVWSTLTGYVMYLGKTGKATVERAEHEGNGKGWYVTYIDRDPEVISKQEQIKRMQKMEERERRMESERIQRIVERNLKMNKIRGNEYEITDLNKANMDKKICFGFKDNAQMEDHMDDNVGDNTHLEGKYSNGNTENMDKKQKQNKRKLSNLEGLMEETERNKKRRKLNEDINDDDMHWVIEGIVVKIMYGDYKGKKGVIMDVFDENNKMKAVVKLLKCKEDIQIKIKEKHLETVVPGLNRKVMILKGKYRNVIGILQTINGDKYRGDIELFLGNKNRKIVSIPYDNFSKLAAYA